MGGRDGRDDPRGRVLDGERAGPLPPLTDAPAAARPLPAQRPATPADTQGHPRAGRPPSAAPRAGARAAAVPAGQRIGDAERNQVQDRLRQAVVDDTLTLEEFGERLALALDARTREELDAVVADLPEVEQSEPPPQPPRSTEPAATRPSPWRRVPRPAVGLAVALGFLVMGVGGVPDAGAVMGGTEISTQQVRDAGGEVDVATLMGGAEIDLRDLRPGDEVTIDGVAVMGGVDILVRPGTDVNLGGLAIMGGRGVDDTIRAADVAEDAPVVNVSVNALMGGVNVGDDGNDDNDDD